MRKIKTVVTYRVPEWNRCNLIQFDGNPSKDTCRFCVKSRGKATCALYNEQLSVNGIEILKTKKCVAATAASTDYVEDDQTESMGAVIKATKKSTLDEYKKTYNMLIKNGLSADAAEKLARELILKGR